MKITFFLNWMGVINERWYEDNNIPYTKIKKFNRVLNREIEHKEYETLYSCGRIDIDGVPNEPFGLEYSVSVMDGGSWNLLGEYLSGLELDYIPSKQELFDMFEKETGHNIIWFKEKG